MEYVVRQRGIEPLWIPHLQRDIEPLADVAAIRVVRAIIRDFRPHILHTHTAKAGAVGRAAAFSAGRDRPQAVVHTFHGHVLRGYFSPLATRGFLSVERALARSTDALIAVSPEVRDDLVQLGVAPADRIRVVRLGLDLESRTAAAPGAREAERLRLGVSHDGFLVGWLGRMTEIKRVDLLLTAFASMKVKASLVLVGDGPLRGRARATGTRPWNRGSNPLHRLPPGRRAALCGTRRRRALLGERRHTRRRDRGAGGEGAGGRDGCGQASPMW